MAGHGWQFSVTVPSWTQATLEGDENVVFYRVEVKVLPPEADAAPRTRSVLRRFSHFTKLHAKLKEELGNSKMAKLGPPSKNRLVGVNKRPDLVEKRRRELESWLWKLIGDGDIARSRVLNIFLELSDAARLVQRAPPSAVPRATSQTGSYAWSEGGSFRGVRGAQGGQGGPGGSEGGYAWSEGGSSSVHEGSSQQSGTATFANDVYPTGVGGLSPVPPSQPPLPRSASDSTSQLPDLPQGPPSDTPKTPQPMARSASTSAGTSTATSAPRTHPRTDAPQPPMLRAASTASEQPSHGQTYAPAHASSEVSNFLTQDSESRRRLGLRVEQRVTVKHHVRALQQLLDTAAGDLQDAMEAIQTERHTKKQLAAQLADLQDRASESGVIQAVEREAELTTSLEQANESSAQLQQQVTDLQAHLATTQSQLQGAQSACTESQQSLSLSQQSVSSLQTQLQQLEQKLTESQHATAAAVAAHQETETAASAAAAGMSQELSQSQQRVSSLQLQVQQAQAQLEQSQQATAQAESTYKDSQAAAAADASQKLSASQQRVTQLLSELDAVRQDLLQVQQDTAQRPGEKPSKELTVDTLLTASPSDLLTDAPTVPPPTTGSSDVQAEDAAADPQYAESMSQLQADKAAADDRLAAVMAEIQAVKHEAADAEGKSRADRKVLAREVKALRKQLETEKQQASAKEAEHAAREAAQEAEHKAREAELAAKEAELAAASETAQTAASSHRENQHSSVEVEDADATHAVPSNTDASSYRENQHRSVDVDVADTTLAGPSSTGAVEPEAPRETDAAASARAGPDVVEAGASHEAADEAEHASTANGGDAGGGGGGGGSGSDSAGDLPQTTVTDTAAAVDPKPSVSAPTSYKQLLQEVAALRQRLHDSSFEVVAGQSAAGYDIKPQAAMEMLSTCDGRLQALMAEANLLGEADLSSQAEASPEDAELRQAFASTLIESGALRQQINALLRDKYEAETQSKDMQSQQVTAPDMKGLFRKLPGMPFMAPHSNGTANHADEEAAKPAFGQGIGDRFAGLGDRFSKSFSRPQQ